MKSNEELIRQQIALGWIASLLILAVTLVTMVLEGLFTDEGLLGLQTDPGTEGVILVKVVSGIYLLMAIGVYVLAAKQRFIRWIYVTVAVLMLLLFVLHQLSHWVYGQRPNFLSHLMDLQHHVSMGWVVYNSVRWARLKPES